ncbi:hypothetical protein [Bradyrhizobium sp. G127]|uniref:hypothetical protein n=1 Tax=Bradyrhizobium sp. G127 TaxID=2904800 RepID=UPI001F2C8E10|nr:hypothetical protein [Bradyrhizobium sp. G127]MCF2522343.1 hypothetical protein [Bradyrhizobium sp. G127]
MAGPVRAGLKKRKSGHSRIRNQNTQIRNQISPVMQKVRGLLPQQKAAQHLALLTDWPLSTCQKLLCGERRENAEQLTVLLRSDFGRDILFVLMGEARPDWFSKYSKQLDVIDANRALKEVEAKVETLRAEVFQ